MQPIQSGSSYFHFFQNGAQQPAATGNQEIQTQHSIKKITYAFNKTFEPVQSVVQNSVTQAAIQSLDQTNQHLATVQSTFQPIESAQSSEFQPIESSQSVHHPIVSSQSIHQPIVTAQSSEFQPIESSETVIKTKPATVIGMMMMPDPIVQR